MKRIRFVKDRVSTARFKLYQCHEIDHTVVFDVTGMDREVVLRQTKAWMGLNYPNHEFRITRSNYRPGYAFVAFVEGSDRNG